MLLHYSQQKIIKIYLKLLICFRYFVCLNRNFIFYAFGKKNDQFFRQRDLKRIYSNCMKRNVDFLMLQAYVCFLKYSLYFYFKKYLDAFNETIAINLF